LTEKPTRCFPVIVDLDFRFSPEDGNIAASKNDFVARATLRWELYKVLDTETDTTFKQQIDVDILTASPYVDKMSSKTASILSSRTYISPQPSNNSYASVC
jgi:hypothetical protein